MLPSAVQLKAAGGFADAASVPLTRTRLASSAACAVGLLVLAALAYAAGSPGVARIVAASAVAAVGASLAVLTGMSMWWRAVGPRHVESYVDARDASSAGDDAGGIGDTSARRQVS